MANNFLSKFNSFFKESNILRIINLNKKKEKLIFLKKKRFKF
jgi:hypothetical protein